MVSLRLSFLLFLYASHHFHAYEIMKANHHFRRPYRQNFIQKLRWMVDLLSRASKSTRHFNFFTVNSASLLATEQSISVASRCRKMRANSHGFYVVVFHMTDEYVVKYSISSANFEMWPSDLWFVMDWIEFVELLPMSTQLMSRYVGTTSI